MCCLKIISISWCCLRILPRRIVNKVIKTKLGIWIKKIIDCLNMKIYNIKFYISIMNYKNVFCWVCSGILNPLNIMWKEIEDTKGHYPMWKEIWNLYFLTCWTIWWLCIHFPSSFDSLSNKGEAIFWLFLHIHLGSSFLNPGPTNSYAFSCSVLYTQRPKRWVCMNGVLFTQCLQIHLPYIWCNSYKDLHFGIHHQSHPKLQNSQIVYEMDLW